MNRLWMLLCLLLVSASAVAEPVPATAATEIAPATLDSIRFRSFGIRQGLSQATARALVQDNRGFIWTGTQDGLNRFDGYEFRSFYRDRDDPSSLSDNHVTALELSGDGKLWVGTMAGGINLFDPAQEAAERFLPGGASGLKGQQVVDLAVDSGGRLWVAAAGGGLQYFDPSNRRFLPISDARLDGLSLRALQPLADGSLLVGSSRGLWRVDHELLSEVNLSGLPTGLAAPELSISALAQDRDGGIHVGLIDGGLLSFNALLALDQRYLHQPGRENSLPDDQIRSLLATRSGELWIGTMNGVAVRRQQQRDFLVWRYDGADQATIAGNRTIALLEDRDGLLWFGTWTGGISVHNPSTRVLRNARHMSAVSGSLPQNPIRAMWRDADGSFWLGVLEGGGLVHFSRERGVIERFTHSPDAPGSLPNDSVSSILRHSDGSLWVGSAGGLAHQLPDGSFERFATVAGDSASLPGNGVIDLHEDPQHRLWIATDDGGLAMLDPATGKVQRFRADPSRTDALNHDSITAIAPARGGGWWIGTQGGGVNRMQGDPLAGSAAVKFSAVTKADGLGADAIGGLVEDLDGHLWISTTVGISEYDPASGSVHNLSASDGLDRAGYFINSYWREPDGTLLFGGLQGLVWFQPKQMRERQPPRTVAISDFRLFNAPLSLQARDPASPLPLGVNYLDELVLRHDQNVWSMVFSSLNFAAPETARYSYWLEGFQDDWISSRGNFRVATFTAVPAGSYRFHVRASNDDGLSWGPETQLPVRILPAPWRSWPAYFAYALALLLIGGVTLYRIRRNLRERQTAQQAIQRSQERLKLALWGSRDELWDLDLKTGELFRENPNPRIAIDASTRFRSTLDYLQWVHPDDHEAVLQALQEHIEGRTEFYEVTYRAKALTEGWVWLLGRGQAVNRSSRGMATRMVGTNRDITALKEAEEELRSLNEELENRVERRTEALKQVNSDLSHTLDELKATQERLVETEKMASLGNLVAGIAHEINTPVGIGVTAASHLEQESRKLGQALAAGNLSRSDLNRFRETAQESSELILRNLERASQLIKSFKQVAVDQSSEQRRQILVRQYLEEILFALRPRLKRTPHIIEVDAPEQLTADTFPGALYQIVVNLINNSLAHGYDEGVAGHILIRAERHEGEIGLLYVDDGVGMNEETVRRIFEPFYTTKRGRGGSGLGMHIVYNLVTRMLGGTIKVRSAPGNGMAVEIRFPAAP